LIWISKDCFETYIFVTLDIVSFEHTYPLLFAWQAVVIQEDSKICNKSWANDNISN
jgi:hypothetical protein